MFLPQALRQSLKQEADEVHKLVTEFDLELNGPQPEYDDEWFEELPPWEEMDNEIKDRLRSIRPTLGEKIRQYILENEKRSHENQEVSAAESLLSHSYIAYRDVFP